MESQMIEKPCRCGKSKKNFRIDIGPFFIGECCIEAGYDDMGNLIKKAESKPEIPVQPEPEKAKERKPRKKKSNE